ncbi:proteinase R-like [Asterias rubens]|uniref:proteinase R-like n=1 Tax=Asterias rubens TaxID=7604 RepID=UPI001454F271|nr:proteinase R-like [Asterias rubens]
MKLLILCLFLAVAYGGLAPLHLAKTRGVPNRYIVKIKVRSIDGVEYIEQDGVGELLTKYWAPSWGIDRIDQRSGTDGTFTININNPGKGVKIYAVGTGLQITHSVFTHRARLLYGKSDASGHGTHCAGIAGGATYGVARDALLRSVRICDSVGQCYISRLFEGLDAVSKDGSLVTNKGVVMIPLAFGSSSSINTIVQKLWDEGFVVTTAAGNAFSSACDTSPQSLSDIITVAGTDKDDRRLSYSSYGSCVDIFAPCKDILSATFSSSSNSATATASGTSFACAHMAGRFKSTGH